MERGEHERCGGADGEHKRLYCKVDHEFEHGRGQTGATLDSMSRGGEAWVREAARHASVIRLPIGALEPQLDVPYWPGGVSARDVLAHPVWHARHTLSIYFTDPSEPVLVDSSTFAVLDGMHRLAGAYHAGRTTVLVKRIGRHDSV